MILNSWCFLDIVMSICPHVFFDDSLLTIYILFWRLLSMYSCFHPRWLLLLCPYNLPHDYHICAYMSCLDDLPSLKYVSSEKKKCIFALIFWDIESWHLRWLLGVSLYIWLESQILCQKLQYHWKIFLAGTVLMKTNSTSVSSC